ncbi:hypothetical protein [Komagataeibacter swingsii]|uniref:hypothetical protein n=1 Tax=Komagataeibacter swingsii TaxID=215220 RepID=UPI0011B5E1A4|nr:hypothetical protein [Komagataeibacter swingsii]GBQ60601.1 hypothetical protein AA16373_1928 [Komagataeibacter swingsii DSM 16373]
MKEYGKITTTDRVTVLLASALPTCTDVFAASVMTNEHKPQSAPDRQRAGIQAAPQPETIDISDATVHAGHLRRAGGSIAHLGRETQNCGYEQDTYEHNKALNVTTSRATLANRNRPGKTVGLTKIQFGGLDSNGLPLPEATHGHIPKANMPYCNEKYSVTSGLPYNVKSCPRLNGRQVYQSEKGKRSVKDYVRNGFNRIHDPTHVFCTTFNSGIFGSPRLPIIHSSDAH